MKENFEFLQKFEILKIKKKDQCLNFFNYFFFFFFEGFLLWNYLFIFFVWLKKKDITKNSLIKTNRNSIYKFDKVYYKFHFILLQERLGYFITLDEQQFLEINK